VLDCETPRGQQFLARQQRLVDICAVAWQATALQLVDPAAPIDAMFARHDRLFRIAEIKARDMAWGDLTTTHKSYLVSFDKLLAGRELASRLRVEYVLVVGLLDATVWWPIADRDGAWLVDMHVQRTATRATCNGGSKVEANAYLSLRGLRRLEDS
jgi:hypothetical protein